MRIAYPSREFDEAVAAVCHGMISDEQARALNGLLRSDAAARDEYILRVELHSRLASEPGLFAPDAVTVGRFEPRADFETPQRAARPAPRRRVAILALAACVALLAAGWWALRLSTDKERKDTTSSAVAMLNRVADAQWDPRDAIPRLGAPLEPGRLRLRSGLAQIVFYSGARVVIEGPAEFQILSPTAASCRRGKLTAEVPPPARGFRIVTPQMNVIDLGTAFGLDVRERRAELHVFKGSVELQSTAGMKQNLPEGTGAVAEGSRPPRGIPANPTAFASLFDLQSKSTAAEVLRYEQWRAASSRLDEDRSLLVHFDFEPANPSDWRLRNSSGGDVVPDATIVGGQWVEGRWPGKPALEFRNVSDRVRLSVPGEFESLTLTAWVRVQGLDRQFNSLFMSDGFEARTVHWLIRKDGVLGLTVVGGAAGDYQIVPSPPVLGLEQLGLWVHVAVVLDGGARRVSHFLNGELVGEKGLKIQPPFRIGAAELGNWSPKGFSEDDPAHIRNFSGAMDEFCLFRRALTARELRALYAEGKPQPDAVASQQ